MAEAGFDVAIHYRGDTDAAEETRKEVVALGRKACLLKADLAREEFVSPLVEQASAALGGPLGVLVNNASTFERDEWDDATKDSWVGHMKPNLRAPFVLMQAFAKALPKDAEGMVLNMLDQRVWSLTLILSVTRCPKVLCGP